MRSLKTKIFKLLKRGDRITTQDITIFTRQFSTLIRSGIPILQALEAIKNSSEKQSLSNMYQKIKEHIAKGNTLSDALKQHPKYFDNITCQFIAAGEQSGKLDTMLDRIAVHKEKITLLKSKVKKALFYPCAVVIIAALVTSILLIFVVPQFAELFSGFGAQLPWLTQLVIDIANEFSNIWWIILLLILSPVLIVQYFKKQNPKFAYTLDKIILNIPFFGKLITKSIIARLTRTLATIFSSGIPLLESLTSLQSIANNLVFNQAIHEIQESINRGNSLKTSLKDTNLFPNMAIQMVAIGEEAGKLSAMLEKVADFYEMEVDQMVDGLSQLLEPLIMAFLGVIIGGLVIAMYLPIFKLGTVI